MASPPVASGSGVNSPRQTLTYRPYSPKRQPLQQTNSLPTTPSITPPIPPGRSISSTFVRPGQRTSLLVNEFSPSRAEAPPVERATVQTNGLPNVNLQESTVNHSRSASPPIVHNLAPILLPSSLPRSNTPPQRSASTSPLLQTNVTLPVTKAATVRAPYLPGFQPAGVTRSLTEILVEQRAKRGEGRRLQVVRIGRRLDKVSLHPFLLLF